MVLQNQLIGCVWKTPFRKSGHIIIQESKASDISHHVLKNFTGSCIIVICTLLVTVKHTNTAKKFSNHISSVTLQNSFRMIGRGNWSIRSGTPMVAVMITLRQRHFKFFGLIFNFNTS